MEENTPRKNFRQVKHGDNITIDISFSPKSSNLQTQSSYWTSLAESGFYVIGLIFLSVHPSVPQSSVTCHYQIFVNFA